MEYGGVADNLSDARKLSVLTVVGCFTRQNIAIEIAQSLKAD
jgi:hypothetical protein